jgi:hypothetical protein
MDKRRDKFGRFAKILILQRMSEEGRNLAMVFLEFLDDDDDDDEVYVDND